MDPTSDESLLSAYLDGELTPQERQILEQRLVHETELRQRLALLEETWHCLDLLEQESPNAEQIETTLQLAAISVSATPPVFQKKNRLWKWSITAVVGFILFVLTFQLGRWSPLDDPSFRPMVERLDWYLAISDDGIVFLRELAIHRIFLPPLPDDVPPIDPDEYQSRRDINRLVVFLSSLAFLEHDRYDAVESPLFYKNIQRYRTLSPEKARQVFKLHREIESAPQSVELILTLQNYYNWSKSLQSYEKTDLRRSHELDKKIESIINLKHRLDERLVNNSVSLSSEMVDMDESTHLAEILANLSPQQQETLLNTDPNQIIYELKSQYEDDFLSD